MATMVRMSSSTTTLLSSQTRMSHTVLRRAESADFVDKGNSVNTSYSYDSLSRLLGVLHQAGGTTIDGASYIYDDTGNRTSKTNYLNGVTGRVHLRPDLSADPGHAGFFSSRRSAGVSSANSCRHPSTNPRPNPDLVSCPTSPPNGSWSCRATSG
jgi:hypothetical protein